MKRNPKAKWWLQARYAIIYDKKIRQDVAEDIFILNLCEAWGVTPSMLFQEDPEWIWKMSQVAALRVERSKKDEKK